MKKKGLSEVITTLILVLLVIVAISIIWVFILNVLQENKEEINLGRFTLSMKILNAKIESNKDLTVSVKRNPGEGELKAINFIISDGTNSKTIRRETNLQELGEEKFTITSDEFTGVEGIAFVKEISIAPVLSSGGKEIKGNIIDNLKRTDQDAIGGMNGLVAYYPFEGNANDVSGNGNNGQVVGNINFVSGKVGQSANFPSFSIVNTQQYINVPNSPSVTLTNSFTMMAWVKLEKTRDIVVNEKVDDCNFNWGPGKPPQHWATVFAKDAAFSDYWFSVECSNVNPSLAAYIDNSGGGIGYQQGSTRPLGNIEKNKWQNVVVKLDGQKVRYYIDGKFTGFENSYSGSIVSGSKNLHIGSSGPTGYNWVGQIDEAMIFNRALSDAEIKAIYDLQK